MGNCVKDNPLRTRADVERAAVALIEPLLPLLSPGKARLHLGDTGAVYPDDIAQMEALRVPSGPSSPCWRAAAQASVRCGTAGVRESSMGSIPIHQNTGAR